ncbi:hypothetical protein GDO81_024188 [Engystomops pustulosus]|uniref:Uncharacterized protein n=1 Tax=Engystomops pustulosus TaxID=76066 RepID=A0AAV6YNI1_ENGPU|nr:hypothetical protein GDO81_024188 [Engystomops pustulosus]
MEPLGLICIVFHPAGRFPLRFILYYACGWDNGRGLEKGEGLFVLSLKQSLLIGLTEIPSGAVSVVTWDLPLLIHLTDPLLDYRLHHNLTVTSMSQVNYAMFNLLM